jgi:hypothetical protein
MTDAKVNDADAVTEAGAPLADTPPAGEGGLEHAKSSLSHAVENIVEKVTATVGRITGRK